MVDLRLGDCLAVLPTLEAESFDALVTDPPAGIAFMGKEWDDPDTFPIRNLRGSRKTGSGNDTDANGFAGGVTWEKSRRGREAFIAFLSAAMREALRLLKPGSYGLVWALPRTSHWTATALEDAGFQIRDRVSHLFGQGFPKAKSCLKPAVEDWWLVRKPGGKVKPLPGLDGCRVAPTEDYGRSAARADGTVNKGQFFDGLRSGHDLNDYASPAGRWPAHLVLSHLPECNGACADDCPVRMLDEQTGELLPCGGEKRSPGTGGLYEMGSAGAPGRVYRDTGGASRFFATFPGERCCILCDLPLGWTVPIIESCDANNADGSSSQKRQVEDSAQSSASAFGQRGTGGKRAKSKACASSAASPLSTSPETNGCTALSDAKLTLIEKNARRAASAASLCGSCATAFAQSVAAISQGQSPESLLGAASICGRRRQILVRSLAVYAAGRESTGIIPTTHDLSLLLGSVRDAMLPSTPTGATASEPAQATRLRYVSKASRAERNAGLEGMATGGRQGARSGSPDPSGKFPDHDHRERGGNNHPTVKALALMRWLCRLITPPGGRLLDPFAGSGSTLVAAAQEGFAAVGIERDADYFAIAERRIAAAQVGTGLFAEVSNAVRP